LPEIKQGEACDIAQVRTAAGICGYAEELKD
jgi:hypothetical protein